MAHHTLRCVQIVPASIEECWAFFSDPRNLARITPPELDFRIVSELPRAMHPGLLIRYRVRPLLGIAITWVSEIAKVEEPRSFVDEQRIGPYARWHHEHSFRSLEPGRTEVTDLIEYEPPFGLLGELVHPLLIAPQLAKIFAFREGAVREHFTAGHDGRNP